MKKNLMQRYGLLLQIPNKALISSSSCCDNRLDFGQYSKTSLFFVVGTRVPPFFSYLKSNSSCPSPSRL